MPRGSLGYGETEEEIMRVKRWASEECGIPEEEIRGFRNPYLQTNPTVREVSGSSGGAISGNHRMPLVARNPSLSLFGPGASQERLPVRQHAHGEQPLHLRLDEQPPVAL
jgi:hypothetical protein